MREIKMRNKSGISLGVADGVGGWVESGVDPSVFSQALMYHAHRYSKLAWVGEPEIDPTQEYEEREEVEGWELKPEECLELALGGVLRERQVVAGSSTACIVNLNASSGVLRAAKSMPFRELTFVSLRQLAKIPTSPFSRYEDAESDSPKDADLYETRLRDGDIVILYTDGLSDNVFMSELAAICSFVSRQFTVSPPSMNLIAPLPPISEPEGEDDSSSPPAVEDVEVQAMADRIVHYAQKCMFNKQRQSPFERAAAREGLFYRGGKPDE
ncbi:hypothetical protein NLI96_g5929 [Meripilus lineatus]|uniref:Protein phosphatase n=1 Tax=Meripilus lineatus TaxID=2056292 RepID=A0AAD5V1X2_9APHY|nr:hypothetical protein NLI96_g5929 [Physisporinus lineatus]